MNIINRVIGHTIVNGDLTAFTSSKGRLSYAELWRRSDYLAGWIDLQNNNRSTPVIVYGHKDPMMLVCFLACVKSGHPYCPVDISVPEERLASIAELIGDPLILIAHEDETIEFDKYGHVAGYDAICRIADMGVQHKAGHECRGEDVFYIIFTSGSTGVPKGVQVTADNLNSFLEWAVTLAGGIGPGDTGLVEMSIVAVRIFAFSYIFGWIDTCFSSLFTALDRPGRSLLVAVFGTLVFPVALLFILTSIFGLTGVWLMAPVSALLSSVLALILAKTM